MKLYIPRPGDKIRLTEDWTFPLHHEYRNAGLAEGLELADFRQWASPNSSVATLPKGTVLAIDRIYIKKPYPEFDSVTFRTVASPDRRLTPKKAGGTGASRRFWVKLADANNLEYEKVEI